MRRFVIGLCWILAAIGCSKPFWPVPVPYTLEGPASAQLWRFDVALPLPAACAVLTRQTFAANPNACPQLKQLRDYLSMRAAHTATVYQGPLVVDDELWALLSTLAKDAALRVKRFPREAPLPSAIRGLDIYTTVDARDESPPQGRWPVAFLYRGFWWTFWLKHAPAPPDPDSGGTPSGSDAFDTLIVFPEYAERQDQ